MHTVKVGPMPLRKYFAGYKASNKYLSYSFSFSSPLFPSWLKLGALLQKENMVLKFSVCIQQLIKEMSVPFNHQPDQSHKN